MTNQSPASIAPDQLRELAAAGGICERCGGVHVLGMDQLIHMKALEKQVELPYCTCSPCDGCGPWKDEATSLVKEMWRGRSPSPHAKRGEPSK